MFVSSVFPTPWQPHKGVFNRALVTALREAGDEVRVVAPVPWTDLRHRPVREEPRTGTRYPVWWYLPRFGHAGHHRWMRRSVLPAIDSVTRGWKPDAILTYWAHPDGTVALEAAGALGIPGVLIVGGSDIRILTAIPQRQAIIRETLRQADLVFAVGEALRQRVLQELPEPEQVRVLHRGVDRQLFHPGPPAEARRALGLALDRPIVAWVGRMVPVKGLDVLLEAWGQVLRAVPRALLVLIGDGELRNRLERRARPLASGVHFRGARPHAELAQWYRAADLMVLPSRSEGVPNVLLESLASGTPFVASDVGGVADLQTAECAVVPPESPGALAEALIRLLPATPMSRRTVAEIPDRSAATAAFRTGLQELIARHAPRSEGPSR